MTNLLAVIGVVVAYFAAGAFYARSQAVPAYERARKAGAYGEDSRRESVALQLLWRVVAWPYAIIFDLIRAGVRTWFFSDIDSRKARAEQLREDAEAWDQKRHTGTPAEQAMAAELTELCKQRAKDLDL